MVVVDVRIVVEDLIALKMRLLVVDTVMRLIEEDMGVGVGVGAGTGTGMGMGMGMGMGVGVGVGVGRVSNVDQQRLVDAFEDGDNYHELAALLDISYQTTLSIIRVWLAEGRVQRLTEGGARNIKLTDDMQAFIRDEQDKLYNNLSPPSPRLVRNWRFAS